MNPRKSGVKMKHDEFIDNGYPRQGEQLRTTIEAHILRIFLRNLTVCPYCGTDDFTHMEDCPQKDNDIISRLVDYCMGVYQAGGLYK